MMKIPDRPLEPPIEWQKEPICPVCGKPCERVFKSKFGLIEGCDICGRWLDATEEEECF